MLFFRLKTKDVTEFVDKRKSMVFVATFHVLFQSLVSFRGDSPSIIFTPSSKVLNPPPTLPTIVQ
jgi:hypothetical protein